MNRFLRVKEILDTAVGGPQAPVGGPHQAFWRDKTRDQFVAFSVLGLPLVTLGDGNGSNIVKALRGEDPFGRDTGNPDGVFRRMPAGRPAVPADQIAFIARWIDDRCPEDDDAGPIGELELLLNGARSGEAFVIVAGGRKRNPATLSLRTLDGSEGDVRVRASQASAAAVTVSSDAAHVSGQPVLVEVQATSASNAQNDTTLEVVRGKDVLARLDLTAIATPVVRFAGRFECRLPTDPDPFDHPWGVNSSFGVYAVEGPDPANPDEPPLDRIIRFHDAVALRPFCGPIGVAVTSIEADVGGASLRFATGDALISLPVRLGPSCKFDGRNRTFAPDGFEPIADFRLEIGSVFSGASAPAVPRETPNDPPGSTAPYADGIYIASPWTPADFGYGEATWAEHAWAVVAQKLARLVAQQPAPGRDTRIRDRRIREHGVNRLPAIGTPLQLMERYTGLIDREVTIAPKPVGVLAYLATLPAVQFYAEFFDFDTDCQTGTVTGTLGAPSPAKPVPARQVDPRRGRRGPPEGT